MPTQAPMQHLLAVASHWLQPADRGSYCLVDTADIIEALKSIDLSMYGINILYLTVCILS